MSRGVRAALLAAIIVAGTVARMDGLTFGFPFHYHPDETGAEIAVSTCSRGVAFERSYRHPPLLVNIACGVDTVLTPVLARLPGYQLHSVFSLRLVSAVAGSLTIAFVYLLALHFVSAAGALGAAFLFACFPAAVASAKYGTPDSLLTMLIVIGLWLQIRLSERADAKSYFLAALATTLAVSAKYNGGFLVLSFLVAHVLAARRHSRPLLELRAIVPASVAVLLGLALGFPAVLFSGEAAHMASGVLDEQRHLTQAGHLGFTVDWRDGFFLFHFRHSILPAAGPLLLSWIAVGLVAMAAMRSSAVAVLFAFAVPYYVAVELIYKVPPSYERYALPLLAIYLIAVAVLVERIVAWLAAQLAARGGNPRSSEVLQPVALVALFMLGAAAPLGRTGALLASIDDDTRERMAHWIGARMDATADDPGLRGRLYAQWPMLAVYYPNQLEQRWLQPIDLARSRLVGTAYVVASSLIYDRYLEFPAEEPKWTRFYDRLFTKGTLIHEESAGAGEYMFHNPTLRLYRIDGATFDPAKARSATGSAAHQTRPERHAQQSLLPD